MSALERFGGELEDDKFSRFMNKLARKFDEEEQARQTMEDQLLDISKSALERKVKAKLKELKKNSSAISQPKWVERKKKKIEMQAAALQADIERRRAESKALHARRKLQFSSIEQQISAFSSLGVDLKKKKLGSFALEGIFLCTFFVV